MKIRSNVIPSLTRPLLAPVCALGLLLAGCASAPPPNEQMAVAEAAVARASTTSTTESAGPELRVAVAKLASARTALAAGEPLVARRLAEQAALDAQVAELHAQTVRSRKSAQESEDAARVLREEINRKTVR
jgi:uncharacterized cupredoxin-like copper-binding protein